MTRLIAICGGIGAGKSVVSRILRSWGYEVYDTDFEARLIMDSDAQIQACIAEKICREAIVAGNINRRRLAEEVFKDKRKLLALNEIVHGAVIRNMTTRLRTEVDRIAFVETAIPRSSGLIDYVDAVWLVEAPIDIRINRVIQRNGLSTSQVEDRIKAQKLDETPEPSKPYTIIINDGIHAVLPQLETALAEASNHLSINRTK